MRKNNLPFDDDEQEGKGEVSSDPLPSAQSKFCFYRSYSLSFKDSLIIQ